MDSGYYDDYQLQEDPEEALHMDALAASEEAALLKGRAFSNFDAHNRRESVHMFSESLSPHFGS